MVANPDFQDNRRRYNQPLIRSNSSVDNTKSAGLINANDTVQLPMLAIVLETLLDAAMIVNSVGEVLQLNAKATDLCQQLRKDADAQHYEPKRLPPMIQPLFDALLDSYSLFPEQKILPEFEVHLPDGTPLRIRGQFLDIPRSRTDIPYALIVIENRQESLRGLAIGDAQQFGFTERETEIWYLRLLGQSYREISQQLYITENTVRKHVKSILAKRRVELDELA